MSLGQLRPFGREYLGASVVRRFEDVVACAPERIAVRTGGGGVTYDSLNRAANRAAHALHAINRGRQRPVALLFGYSQAGISALLGVLKAGAFYVPLDPAHPLDRLRHVVEDAQPSVIVTDAEHVALAHEFAASRCAVLTIDELLDRAESDTNPDIACGAEDLAAIFYTSGSTGRPKGVMQTHRLILHRVAVDTSRLALRPDDRLSLLSPATYSVSLRHLFGALLNGAMICPFDVVEHGVAAVPAWIAREGITVYFSVPSVFREWTRLVDRRSDVRTVRVMQIGGDTTTSDDVDRYRQLFSFNCVFVSSFASNEAGVIRYYVADTSTPVSPGPLPAGDEVEDKQVLVLGDDGRVLGPGLVGRIAIRSAFLSPGYWQQPALTEASFRIDPENPSARVYYTGDRGVLRPDGCLLFKGRVETRAKIRGITVEVEEVEAALAAHPAIAQVVVAVTQDDRADSRLTAYVVPCSAAAPTVTALRAFLRQTLPACMIPSSYVFLDALPTTPHGKIDRANLPSPDAARPPLETAFCPPHGEVEEELAAICEAIIGVHPIGIDDDLFDLGLDSLGALVVAAEIETQLGRPTSAGLLFGAPTIRTLASALQDERLTRPLVPIRTEGSRPPFFWVHGDSSARPLARTLGSDQPMYLLDHQSQDGRRAARTDVNTIATLHLSAIRSVQPAGPYFLGGYSFGGMVALEIAQQLADAGEEVGLLALLDPPSLDPTRTLREASGNFTSDRDRSAPAGATRHLKAFARLRPREYWSYIMPRLLERLAPVVPALRMYGIRGVYRACVLAGRRLPAFTRKTYIFDVYDRARARYTPRPYEARSLLFKGASRVYADASDWEQMLTSCEVRVLHATHREMRSESHVHLWAETLRDALVCAQDEALDSLFVQAS